MFLFFIANYKFCLYNCLLPKLRTIVVLLAVVCGCLFVFLFIIWVKKAMLGYMSHRATLWSYYCRFYVQRGTNAPISWILFAFSRQPLLYGRLAIVSPASAVEFISYFSIWMIKSSRYEIGFIALILLIFNLVLHW